MNLKIKFLSIVRLLSTICYSFKFSLMNHLTNNTEFVKDLRHSFDHIKPPRGKRLIWVRSYNCFDSKWRVPSKGFLKRWYIVAGFVYKQAELSRTLISLERTKLNVLVETSFIIGITWSRFQTEYFDYKSLNFKFISCVNKPGVISHSDKERVQLLYGRLLEKMWVMQSTFNDILSNFTLLTNDRLMHIY